MTLARKIAPTGIVEPTTPPVPAFTPPALSAPDFDWSRTKRCCTCRKPLPLSAFHRDSHSDDGRKASCRACRREMRAGRQPRAYVEPPTSDFVTTGELATRYGYTRARIHQVMLDVGCCGWRQNIAGRSLRVYPRVEAHAAMGAHCEEMRVSTSNYRVGMVEGPLTAAMATVRELSEKYGLCFNGVARVLRAGGLSRTLCRWGRSRVIRAYDRAKATEIMERHMAARHKEMT